MTQIKRNKMSHLIQAGVATGKEVQKIFKLAKQKGFALPAVNVIGSNSINAVLETAKELNAPVIVQFSNGGAQFNAGKGLSNEKQQAAVAGAVAGAKHVHQMAAAYGVSVILHTDHCAKKLLLWIDGLLDASETHFKATCIGRQACVLDWYANNLTSKTSATFAIEEYPHLHDLHASCCLRKFTFSSLRELAFAISVLRIL